MTSEDQEIIDKIPCANCGELITSGIKFCNHCGVTQSAKATDQSDYQWALLKQAAAFYSIYIVVCMLSAFVDEFKTIGWALIFEFVSAGIAIIFFAYNWTDTRSLLVWKNFSWQKLSAYGGIAMLCAFLVHYAVGWLNVTIFSKDEHYYAYFAGRYAAMFWIIFFTAVTPALFEELGFRGYLLQILLKVADKDQAVYISAFLFAIIHLSFISLFWLIPFALLIGYVRVREDTIWYGVFFHFFFNLTACLFELL